MTDLLLRVRPATAQDVDILLEWRNDPATRAASRDSGLVDRDGHERWLTAVLADPTRILLIAYLTDGDLVGTVRLDAWPDPSTGDFEISATVAPTHRGRGLYREFLLAAENYLLQTRSRFSIVGNVKPESSTPRRVLPEIGYVNCDEIDGAGIWMVKHVGAGR